MGKSYGMAIIFSIGILLTLSSMLVPQFKAENPHERDILLQALGGTAEFAADKAYQEADVYFHAGLRDDHHHHEHEYEEDSVSLPFHEIIERMHGETAPKIHRHIEGEEEKELLPWFMIAVRLNPRHIEAWRAGAYWFYRTGDSEHAIEFIREGISNNPKEYRLHLDLGILMYRLRDWPEALKSLETAESLWEESSEDAEFDLRAIRSYIKYIKERN